MSILLYIDIETIPGPNAPDMQELSAEDYLVKDGTHPSNYKDETKIMDWYANQAVKLEAKYNEDLIAQKEKQQELHAKQALDSMEGKIVCVSYACGDAPVTTIEATDEVVIIDSLLGALEGLKMSNAVRFCFVGHNVFFDLQFLYHKAIKYNSRLKVLIPKKNEREYYVDTQEEWMLGQYNKFKSLSSICEYLGIEQMDEIKGADVWDAYKAGRIDQIVQHCESDVNAVRELYKRLR